MSGPPNCTPPILWTFSRSVMVTLALACTSVSAQIVSDDFNDGNDGGWTRSNPLAPFGGTATYSFPGGNSYRMEADPSPNPAALGAARTGSIRAAEEYTDSFYVAVDLVDWNDVIEQDVGILALVREIGAGTLDGYSFSYDVDAQRMYLSRLDNEMATGLGDFAATLDPSQDYRLVFQGFMGELRAELYFLVFPEAPFGVVTAFDAAFSSGPCGLFVAHGVGDGAGIADATFDNYFSSPETDVDADGLPDQWEFDAFGDLSRFDDEDSDSDGQTNLEEFIGGSDPNDIASRSGISSVEVTGGDVVVSFPITAGRSYGLESSLDLENWTAQPGAVFADNGATGSLTIPTGGQSPLFVRVNATVD